VLVVTGVAELQAVLKNVMNNVIVMIRRVLRRIRRELSCLASGRSEAVLTV